MQFVSIQPAPGPGRKELWKTEISESITSSEELLHLLELEHLLADFVQYNPAFRLRVPRPYVAKIQKGQPDDPLLLQVLPTLRENKQTGFVDPVGDLAAMPTPGLLHKYHGRALLITTGACAIHCRYCFRRHFPYSETSDQASRRLSAIEYLRKHPEIQEVILSGGDPLMLDDAKLANLCAELETVPHVKWLRLHTRLPVVLPSRINRSLLLWMKNSRFKITVVIHANHANELAHKEMKALQQLQDIRVKLLNQSVLLKNVNDNATALIQLSQRLHDCGVSPYYLHLLDKVQGALHFDVSREKACNIMTKLRSRLPGFLVPKLVREDANTDSKTAIFNI
jgi:EF-P beta-lysylation protein EpmB